MIETIGLIAIGGLIMMVSLHHRQLKRSKRTMNVTLEQLKATQRAVVDLDRRLTAFETGVVIVPDAELEANQDVVQEIIARRYPDGVIPPVTP